METHNDEGSEQASPQATQLLHDLASDREGLTSRLTTPWGLMAVQGLAAALYVLQAAFSHPGAGYRPSPVHYWLGLILVLIVWYVIPQRVGLRWRRMGARAWWVFAGMVATTLLMFSTGLG